MKAYMKIRKQETVTNTPVNEDSGRDKSKQELGMKLLLRKRIKHTHSVIAQVTNMWCGSNKGTGARERQSTCFQIESFETRKSACRLYCYILLYHNDMVQKKKIILV